MSLNKHNRSQIEAALSADNRFFAWKHYGHEVTDPEILLRYFIKNGGAEAYAKFRESPQGECDDGTPPQAQG